LTRVVGTGVRLAAVALLTCTDCGRQVSDAAPACPGCGRPLAAPAPPAPQKTGSNNVRPASVIGAIVSVIGIAA
jgi:hypothetical protein